MTRGSRGAWVIWSVVGLVSAGVCVLAALLIGAERRESTAEAQRQVDTLVRAAAASLNRNLLGIDLMLAGLTQLPGLLGPDGQPAEAGRTRALLRASVNQSLAARDLVLLDRQGRVVAAADPATVRLGVTLPEGFLAGVLAQPASQLVVSAPMPGAGTAERVLYVARPLGPAAQAKLVGLAEVPVATLTTLMSPALVVEGLSVTLEDDQGRLLASAPAQDAALGRVHPIALPRLAPGQGRPASAQRAAGRLDGEPALVAVRPTLYGSLLVAAGLSEAAMLERSLASRQQVLAVSAVFIALTLTIGAVVQTALARRAATAAELARAKLVLEEALASMDEGFLLWDADDRVVLWNERFLELHPHMQAVMAAGVSWQTVVEAGARAAVPEADEATRAAWIRRRVTLHHADGREFELPQRDGRVISAVERRTANGGIVSIYRDITQAKAAAGTLEAARKAAESASEAKTRFLATMSHEIRTPLNGVLGMNGLLLETPLDARQRKYAETIRSSGEALLSILNDVLDMSKLEAGRMGLERAPFNPSALVGEVVTLLDPRAQAKRITLAVEAPETATTLLGDAGRLRQVLYNLLGNAIKFTDRGGVTVRTRTRLLAGGEVEWALTVEDTGIGIPPEAMDTLFDRFTQADTSTSRRFGGSGLGLAICRQLVELMDGRIEVRSEPGTGSTFTVTLRLAGAPPAAADDEAPAPRPGARTPDGPSRPLRVLVAEDNRINQLLLASMLEQLGHHVDVVGDGREALRQVLLAHYDIVLMDIQMPEMDGVAATRAIRELPAPLGQLPIIAVSANVLPAQRAAYLAAGMNDYLPKPFDREQLEAVLAGQMAPA